MRVKFLKDFTLNGKKYKKDEAKEFAKNVAEELIKRKVAVEDTVKTTPIKKAK